MEIKLKINKLALAHVSECLLFQDLRPTFVYMTRLFVEKQGMKSKVYGVSLPSAAPGSIT